MKRRGHILLILSCLICLGLALGAFAQAPARGGGQAPAGPGAAPPRGQAAGAPAGAPVARGAAGRPPLFFKEEWKQTAANDEHPVTQESVANPNLELKLYGQSHDVLLTGTATNESNPIHVWTGMCTTPCAVALRDKTNLADLTGLARMKWVTKMSGFHQVRPFLKLADGTLLVGDRADGSTVDWLVSEFSLSDMRWRRLDAARLVTTGDWVVNPNLSRVDEIGFVDLMPGSGHGQGGWADVATIEVYGRSVKRDQ